MRQFVVDAFTDHVFAGNPAAVCILSHWIPDALMQDIAMENRFSETAFVVKEGAAYHLRWFTPGGEIDLCGHATLATAYVLLNHDEKEPSSVTFTTLSGELFVRRTGDKYEMEFPAYELRQLPVTDEMAAAFGERPQEAWLGRDLSLRRKKRFARCSRTWNSWHACLASCSMRRRAAKRMTACRGALHRSSKSRKTLSAALAIAISPRIGASASAVR